MSLRALKFNSSWKGKSHSPLYF